MEWIDLLREIGPPLTMAILLALTLYAVWRGEENRKKAEAIRAETEKKREEAEQRAADELAEAQRRITALMETRLAERDRQIEAVQKRADDLHKTVQERETHIEELQQQQEVTAHKQAEAERTAEGLRVEVDQLKRDLQAEREARRKLEDRAYTLEIDNARLKDDNGHLLAANTRMAGELDAMRPQMKTLTDQINNLTAIVEEKELRIKELEAGRMIREKAAAHDEGDDHQRPGDGG